MIRIDDVDKSLNDKKNHQLYIQQEEIDFQNIKIQIKKSFRTKE